MRRAYRGGLTIAAAFAFVAGAACERKPAVPLPESDHPLALLARPTLDGSILDVAAFSGKVVAVNVWSPSCVPCAHEAPGLQRVADELAPRGFALVTVMVEGTREEARTFVERAGLTAPVVIGDAEILGRLRVLAY